MRQYFKGYYFKCSTGNETVAFIPALHQDGTESKASLQIITNDSAYAVEFPKIRFGRKKFKIKIGQNLFSEKGIYLNLDTKECRIHGKLKFGGFQKIRYDIMGPFRYIPYMQCRHSIISMRHAVNGKITINEKTYRIHNGVGYIEGDRGCSFPTEYVWTQCHDGNVSIVLSAADIPFLGFQFKGVIGIVMIGDREYRLATYLGAKICSLGGGMAVVKQGKYTLWVKLIESEYQSLHAPVNGKMQRTIRESASCRVWYQFTYDNKKLLEFTSETASFEYELKH